MRPQDPTQIPDWLDHVGPGWHQILATLHLDLMQLAPGYSVSQIKEKFGGLRVYLDHDPNSSYADGQKVNALVDAAESLAAKACEDCGLPGELREGSWLVTMCDGCWAKRLVALAARWKS